LNTDMRMFESSQKDGSRAQSADSWKACRKPRASVCRTNIIERFAVMQVRPSLRLIIRSNYRQRHQLIRKLYTASRWESSWVKIAWSQSKPVNHTLHV